MCRVGTIGFDLTGPNGFFRGKKKKKIEKTQTHCVFFQDLWVLLNFSLICIYINSFSSHVLSQYYNNGKHHHIKISIEVCSDRILTCRIKSIRSPAKVGLVVTDLITSPVVSWEGWETPPPPPAPRLCCHSLLNHRRGKTSLLLW